MMKEARDHNPEDRRLYYIVRERWDWLHEYPDLYQPEKELPCTIDAEKLKTNVAAIKNLEIENHHAMGTNAGVVAVTVGAVS